MIKYVVHYFQDRPKTEQFEKLQLARGRCKILGNDPTASQIHIKTKGGEFVETFKR